MHESTWFAFQQCLFHLVFSLTHKVEPVFLSYLSTTKATRTIAFSRHSATFYDICKRNLQEKQSLNNKSNPKQTAPF
jgi:hypothetical protein